MKKAIPTINLFFLLLALSCFAFAQPPDPDGNPNSDGGTELGGFTSCLPEGIVFSTQGQVDSFQINHPNCDEIEGNVIINGSEIKNLNSLNVVTSIGGYLSIGYTDSLTNLNGFENLTEIGGDFLVIHTEGLINFTGLENVYKIGGGLHFEYNYSLIDFAGLNNIDSITDVLVVTNNVTLNNFAGLNSLIYIGDNVTIENNDSLKNLTGINNLEIIGRNLYINNNPAMTDLGGLNSLKYIELQCEIINNNILVNLSGLENLDSIGGNLGIGNNPRLTGLDSLYNLKLINGALAIGNNDSLSSLAGLGNINSNSVTSLIISDNPLLSTCNVISVCNYLADPEAIVTIENNAPGCNSPEEVDEACQVSIDENGISRIIRTYPNPFYSSIRIEFELGKPAEVSISIFNDLGEQIELIKQQKEAGKQHFTWVPAVNQPAGVYYYLLQTGNEDLLSGKMLLMK